MTDHVPFHRFFNFFSLGLSLLNVIFTEKPDPRLDSLPDTRNALRLRCGQELDPAGIPPATYSQPLYPLKELLAIGGNIDHECFLNITSHPINHSCFFLNLLDMPRRARASFDRC